MLLFNEMSGDVDILQTGLLPFAGIACHWLIREMRTFHEICEFAAKPGFRAVSKR